jgi:hypothetical protein
MAFRPHIGACTHRSFERDEFWLQFGEPLPTQVASERFELRYNLATSEICGIRRLDIAPPQSRHEQSIPPILDNALAMSPTYARHCFRFSQSATIFATERPQFGHRCHVLASLDGQGVRAR